MHFLNVIIVGSTNFFWAGYAHMLGKLYYDCWVPLLPAIGLLVGMLFFEVSLDFHLVKA